MITLYLLFIVASIVLAQTSSIEKKESFLSIACDLSLMLVVFYWGIENIILTIIGTIIILAIYFIIGYFTIFKKANSAGISSRLIEQAKKRSLKTYFSILFILSPLAFRSETIMIISLIIYIVIDRSLFFYKYRSLV